MKLNISNPLNNVQKSVEIDDEKKLLSFFERRIGNEVRADSLGEEFTGYVLRITGGNDKQGFPMMQGILTNNRVRILFKKGMKCYRPRKKGERKRKSVRGCVVGQDLSALNLVIVKKGENEIPGLTDKTEGKKLGPKRANKIRKLFGLDKSHDVTKFAFGRKVTKNNKTKTIKPKIQRLVTEKRLIRKRRLINSKKKRREEKRAAVKNYKKVLRDYRENQLIKIADEVTKPGKVKKTIQKKLSRRDSKILKSAGKKDKQEKKKETKTDKKPKKATEGKEKKASAKSNQKK